MSYLDVTHTYGHKCDHDRLTISIEGELRTLIRTTSDEMQFVPIQLYYDVCLYSWSYVIHTTLTKLIAGSADSYSATVSYDQIDRAK